MHNANVELQGKCRQLYYAKVDIPEMKGLSDAGPLAGDVLDVGSGGGAMESLSGEDLILWRFNDPIIAAKIGCIEEYYTPVPSRKPQKIDLTLVEQCLATVTAHKASTVAERDFVFETGLLLFDREFASAELLRHHLKREEVRTRGDSEKHARITQAALDLDNLCNHATECCTALLVSRDDAITWRPLPTPDISE